MINKDNFKDILRELEYTEIDNLFIKDFPEIDATLKVDFSSKEIIYPEEKGFIVNERQTCNFSQNENFVVFECIHRLFQKSYKPNHIEIEPRWQVGHGPSGGRADIMIKDNSNKSLFIIECKTYGKEFNDAWKKTLLDGGQIFTYANEERSTQYVCLYTSGFVDGKLTHDYYLIGVEDNPKVLDALIEKDHISYKNAKLVNKEEVFKCWKETYAQDFAKKGLFEEDIPAYDIGKKKYSVKDISPINSTDIQGKYHQFATILRQHNVSGRENAFDKLVNLFLCKIVDETNNPQQLKFYWKGIAYDTFFDLQDRLQKLYQEGMKRFLGEEVTYIDNEAIDEAFRFFKKDPDATRETIKKYFRELKFFTNNDFAFIDVHNEKLFYQNSAVLLKVVQMLQDIKLKDEDGEHQFLGDMFEGFLDQGIKQSEGQFFTPMPIVKFILKSLPLQSIISNSEQIPKVIDYACGAGHFLNVYAQEIKSLLLDTENVDLASHYKNVVGIEKEYRLSKVSKVSAFMYGQDDIKVIYADALAENPEIKENEYSILVANPPYSVKGFLETLSETDRNKFQLINSVDVKSYPNNNSIETFFIEKAKQLLKPGGVAGIIVPSSILSRGKAKSTSKSKNIYVTSREILLKYFDIIAITEFGSGTFGKTGTGTVTLFLRRKNENPSPSEHYLNRIESWFNGSHQMDEVFEDKNLVEDYCERIGVDFLNYLTLLNGSVNNDLLESDVFKTYITEFEKSNERKDLRKKHANQINGIEKSVISSITKLLKEKGKTRSKETARAIGLRVLEKRKRILVSEQKHETNQLFHKYLVKNEKEKLLFFIMAKLNPQNVLIVRSPSKNTEMKNFLGYEWSSAKGREGIKYMGGIPFDDVKEISEEDDDIVAELEDDDKRVLSNILNLNNISTPLYDPKNKFNTRKINYLIEKNFKREEFEIPEELSDLVTELQLTEMIDFNNVDFNKAINLIQKNKIKIDTKWDLVKLGSVADVKNGGTPDTNNPSYWNGSICWATLADTKQKYLEDTKKKITPLGLSNSNAVLLPVNTVIFSSRATIGEVTINKIETCTNQGYKNFVCDPLQLNYEYLYYILVRYKEEIEKIIPPGTKYKEINSHDIKNFHIPLPPLFEQEKLVKKLLKFEKEKNKLFKTGMTIDEFEELANLNRQKIIDTFIK